MTLLACIPCCNLSAFVMCADSQETVEHTDENGKVVGSYRKTVQKIKPLGFGDLQVVVTGSGNPKLIDSFIEKLKRTLNSTPCVSIDIFVGSVEAELMEFYRQDVAVSADKSLSMFVAAALKSTHEFGAWIQENITLIPIVEQVLEGWRETLYVKIADRVCSGEMTAEQAVLAGIYVLTVAEETCNYVRGPMSVIVINAQGVHEIPQRYVDDVAVRLTKYEAKLNSLFLACADTHLPVHQLEDTIEAFKATALSLHRRDIDQQAENTSLFDLLTYNPLQSLPPGPIAFGTQGISVEHDREKIEEALERWKQAREFVAERQEHIHCDGCGNEFDVLMASKMGIQSRQFPCPKCRKLNRVTQVEFGSTTI